MSRWFKAKPWQVLERGEPVSGDVSVLLVESENGLSLVVSEFLGSGTHLARTEAILVEDDWDGLVAAVQRWRASEDGSDGQEPSGSLDTGGLAGLEPSELTRLLVGLELSRAAGVAQRVGDRAAGWLAGLARRAVDGPGVR